jgi:hypothetical protein
MVIYSRIISSRPATELAELDFSSEVGYPEATFQ